LSLSATPPSDRNRRFRGSIQVRWHPDTTFDTDGVATAAAVQGATLDAVAVLPADRVFAVGKAGGVAGNDFLILRYAGDGSLEGGPA
jgi:hypothetical protein